MNNSIQFISNTDDDLHCTQSSYMMIVKYFEPDFEVNWEEWSQLTGFQAGKGTWAYAGLLWFKERGYDVIHKSLFNNKSFIELGGQYLVSEYGEDVGMWQIQHSNLPLEQSRAAELMQANILRHIEPTLSDIKSYLNTGYLVRCLVNSNALNDRDGYFGHSVVVSGYDDEGFTIQDPGLPPVPNRHISYEKFENAWAYPNKEAKEMDAIKMTRNN